jgi:hypothetical protein
MSIDIGAQVREPHTLAVILHHAESYVGAVPHPPFVVLTPGISAAEFVLGPFEIPAKAYEDNPYRMFPVHWGRERIHLGAGHVAETSLWMSCFVHADERGLSPMQVAKARSLDKDLGYAAGFHVHRTRESFCLTLLVATAIADLNHALVEDSADLLGHGAWVEPSVVASLFARHHGVTSFEALIDAVFDEHAIAPQWQSARSKV